MSENPPDLERLRALFLEHFHVEVPSADADLLESGVLDSLQLVDLLLLIEQRFARRIAIESIDLDDLRSLSRIASLLATPDPLQSVVREVRRGGKYRG
jgi:acyl carrier protein